MKASPRAPTLLLSLAAAGALLPRLGASADYPFSEIEISEFSLPNSWQPGGSGKTERCVYCDTESWSAVAALCNLPNADCARGVAVSGFSQGANLASLAANYNDHVRAAYLIGNVEPTVTDCWDSTDLLLSNTRILSVMGELDNFGDGSCETVKASLESTTGILSGIACDALAYNCLQPEGHGWYIVQPSETAHGGAGHCFQFCNDSCNCLAGGTGVYDENYYSELPGGMLAAHEWLSNATFYEPTSSAPSRPPTASPTGAPQSGSPTESGGPSCVNEGGRVKGDDCTTGTQCCSDNCKGKAGAKTCK